MGSRLAKICQTVGVIAGSLTAIYLANGIDKGIRSEYLTRDPIVVFGAIATAGSAVLYKINRD